MDNKSPSKNKHIAPWFARLTMSIVFTWNVLCAFGFIFTPERFIGAYELTGTPGTIALQGLGIAFLMWNATYPPAILNPTKHLMLFRVILVQQLIGLIGESFLLLSLDNSYHILAGSIVRFIVFDAAGLIIMLASYILLVKSKYSR